MGYVLGLIYSSSSSTLSCVSVFISIWVSCTEGWTLGEVAESWRSGEIGEELGWGQFFSGCPYGRPCEADLPLDTLPTPGWEVGASGLTELGSASRPPCAEACILLLVSGDKATLRDRPAPIALWFRQHSWACRRAGRLGMAGKPVQALGPLPPRPGCGVGPRRTEVPTAQLLHPL